MWGAVAVSGQRPKTRHRTASYTRHRIAWPWMSTVPVLQSPGLGHRSVWVLDKAHCEEHGFGARHPGPWCTSVTLDESVLTSLDSSAVKMGRSDRSSMRDPLRGLRAHRKDLASASPASHPPHPRVAMPCVTRGNLWREFCIPGLLLESGFSFGSFAGSCLREPSAIGSPIANSVTFSRDICAAPCQR